MLRCLKNLLTRQMKIQKQMIIMMKFKRSKHLRTNKKETKKKRQKRLRKRTMNQLKRQRIHQKIYPLKM
ncbi:hypothetical protein G9C98_004153 [Cotesia typhae]|uniref:Uncharacterized protein n=1 Tax=Cotesia typhae TaxID=2053667 RepID=A0A8J5R682_9HYME|nr:hypothetical protein G9C98_004153 [Cotesia typhae]